MFKVSGKGKPTQLITGSKKVVAKEGAEEWQNEVVDLNQEEEKEEDE